ncbi:MAG: YraN family protein [Patescibacteria group bacterium]|jgi:putative endonuclease
MFDKTKNKSTGNAGEDAATEFLRRKGYKIIDRNLRLFCGEIDILAEYKKVIVIVEVKTVRGAGFGLAQDLVRFAKQNKLRLLARAIAQKYPGRMLRIDVIGVDYSSGEPKIEHLENAVEG